MGRGQKKILDPLIVSQHVGTIEEEQVLLNADLSLHPPYHSFVF